LAEATEATEAAAVVFLVMAGTITYVVSRGWGDLTGKKWHRIPKNPARVHEAYLGWNQLEEHSYFSFSQKIAQYFFPNVMVAWKSLLN
jgi:hypothetical protein